MDRDRIEQVIRGVYDSRLLNCAAECAPYFSDNAVLRVEGLPQDPSLNCLQTIEQLVEAWTFNSVDNLLILVDKDTAVARYNLAVRHNATSKKVHLEVVDWIRLNEKYQVEELVQYMDTVKLMDAVNPETPRAKT